MLILLTWCEFQKYALTSLQQLLADHPPAPEGLDPDIGTGLIKHLSSFVFSLLFSFLLWWHEKITSYQLRQDHIFRKIFFFFFFFLGGGREGNNERCAKRGWKWPNAQFGNNTQLVQRFVWGGGAFFLWEVLRKNTEVIEDKFFPWVVFVFVCLAEVAPGEWTDDTIKLCLYLYLALLPQNHKLFHE